MRKKRLLIGCLVLLLGLAGNGFAAENKTADLRQWTEAELATLEENLAYSREASGWRASEEGEIGLEEALDLAEQAVRERYGVTAEEMERMLVDALFFPLDWDEIEGVDTAHNGYNWLIGFQLPKPDGSFDPDFEPYSVYIDPVSKEVFYIAVGSNG